MDEDDLPPPKGAPHEETAAGSLGRVFGTLAFIGLFAVAAAGLAFVALHWAH
jgi:hypothetical protein